MLFVPLDHLATELGVHRTSARRIALKLFKPTRRQVPELGHRQRTLCWTREEADQIIAERRRQGFEIPALRSAS